MMYCCRAASIVAVLQQRLRERDLEARLQARIEAADRIVGRGPRGVPRHAPRARAPRQPLPDAGRREPVVDVDAAFAEQEVRRRRDAARAAEHRREHRREGAAALADARRLDLGAEPDDREIRIVLDGAAHRVVERQLRASSRLRRRDGRSSAGLARDGAGAPTSDDRCERSSIASRFILQPPRAAGSARPSSSLASRLGPRSRASAPRACRSTAPRTA